MMMMMSRLTCYKAEDISNSFINRADRSKVLGGRRNDQKSIIKTQIIPAQICLDYQIISFMSNSSLYMT